MREFLLFATIDDESIEYKSWLSPDREYDIAFVYTGTSIDRELELKQSCDLFFKGAIDKWQSFYDNVDFSTYQYICLIDNDVTLRGDLFNKSFRFIQRNNIRVAGPAYSIRGDVPAGNHIADTSTNRITNYIDRKTVFMKSDALIEFNQLYTQHKSAYLESTLGFLINTACFRDNEPFHILDFAVAVISLKQGLQRYNKHVRITDENIAIDEWQHSYQVYAEINKLFLPNAPWCGGVWVKHIVNS